MEIAKDVAEYAAGGIEIFGVGMICLGVAAASVRAAIGIGRSQSVADWSETYRHGIIRSILVGLDLLVAADIINTVAVDFSFHAVGILAVIVLIRTFLSFTLEVEMTGHWPWQKNGH